MLFLSIAILQPIAVQWYMCRLRRQAKNDMPKPREQEKVSIRDGDNFEKNAHRLLIVHSFRSLVNK